MALKYRIPNVDEPIKTFVSEHEHFRPEMDRNIKLREEGGAYYTGIIGQDMYDYEPFFNGMVYVIIDGSS